MRLSRSRVLLRVALLAIGGLFMLWRAASAWRASGEVDPSAAALQSRIAIVAALIGVLALLTALSTAVSLRKRRRAHTLQLGEPPRPDGPGHS